MVGLPPLAEVAPGGGLAPQRTLDAASALIRRHCGWHVAPVLEQTMTVNGPGGRLLILPTLALLDVTACSNGGVPVDLVDDLEWSADGRLQLRVSWWSPRFRSVTVTIRHGDEAAGSVLAELCQIVAARAATSPTGRIREQVGAVGDAPTMVAPNAAGGVVLMEHEIALLTPWRISGRV